MTEIVGRQRLFDGLAIGASSLCLVHCLALPVLFVLLPTLGAMMAIPEDFHFWALIAATVTSAVAILFGYRVHRRILPAILAVLGVGLLATAEFFFHGTLTETVWAVSGSVLLATAHVTNLHGARHVVEA